MKCGDTIRGLARWRVEMTLRGFAAAYGDKPASLDLSVAALPQHMAVSLRLTVKLSLKTQEATPPLLKSRGVASDKQFPTRRKAEGFPLCAAPKARVRLKDLIGELK